MRRLGGMALAALLLTLAGPAAAQRDPVNTDRLIRRLDRLPAPPSASLSRDLGLPEWNALVLAHARRIWIDGGGRETVIYRTQLPSGFNFDRYGLTHDGAGWSGRWVHMRRVEVTDAASRTFPLDAIWRLYLRHGRNAASPAYQRERQALLPDAEAVARSVLVRVEATDSRRCPALAAAGERAWRISGESGGPQSGPVLHRLEVRRPSTRHDVSASSGAAGSREARWGEQLWRTTANCWRLQSINNPNRR